MAEKIEMTKGERFNLNQFIEENETVKTIAYEHALNIAYIIAEEMERQGLTQKELAERMGMKESRLSKLLNTQPNMTLETIARFEKALGIKVDFVLKDQLENYCKLVEFPVFKPYRSKRHKRGVENFAPIESLGDLSGSELRAYLPVDSHMMRSAA